MDRGVATALVVVAAHLLAGAAHGYVHDGAAVSLTTAQTAFVWLVATAGPVAALIVLWRGAVRAGATALLVTMAAASIFDAYYHGIARTPDHVHAVAGPWADAFLVTAALVSITDLLGVLAGVWLYRRSTGD